ncbi:hypothetical protein MJO29_016370 [Puccinia striiformis f. sp. tritici]|nr:hypothetical protein MJO29_016370 [Puccinia striiformis f. sp. tritici]
MHSTQRVRELQIWSGFAPTQLGPALWGHAQHPKGAGAPNLEQFCPNPTRPRALGVPQLKCGGYLVEPGRPEPDPNPTQPEPLVTGFGFGQPFLISDPTRPDPASEDNHSSDHQAIKLHLNIGKPCAEKRLILPAWKNLDCADALKKNIRPLSKLPSVTTGPLNNQVQILTQVVTKAQDLLCKTISVNSPRSKSWWCNKTLNPIIDVQKRSRRWFLLTKSPVAA